MKNGKPYAWTVGNDGDYEINLPTGDYEIYAAARGCAQTATRNVTVLKGGEINVDFGDIRPPARFAPLTPRRCTRCQITKASQFWPLIACTAIPILALRFDLLPPRLTECRVVGAA